MKALELLVSLVIMKILFFENKFFPKGKEGPGFDQEFNFAHERGVAFEGTGAFFASGINHGGDIHFLDTSDGTSIDLKGWVTKSFGDNEPVASKYELGTFYKRIWRPLAFNSSFHKAISQEKLNESFVALRILLTKLEALFETIEPSVENLPAYGHKIRELLLLACMEVESAWAAVLKENNYATSGDRLTTRDYIKLKEVMFLDAYDLSLQSYPRFPSFNPFKSWVSTNATESLVWYDSYNKTKHDREENLKFATLENVVHAVGAAVVMFYAQFGFNFGAGPNDPKSSVIRNIFKLTTTGLVKYEKEFYIPKVELQAESRRPAPSWEWVAINYPF